MGSLFVQAALLLASLIYVQCSYVITTPRLWTEGSKSQVCLTVLQPSPADTVSVTVTTDTDRQIFNRWGPPPPPAPPAEPPVIVIPDTVITSGEDSTQQCVSLLLPETSADRLKIVFKGKIGNSTISEKRPIQVNKSEERIFIQTDKYLYKDGQKVQFRILSIKGPFFKVQTDPYSEVWVENPLGSRIAQWRNLSNTAGLLHLDMQLIDEADRGMYLIKVKATGSSATKQQSFKVEDYVVPRFELSVRTPDYILADGPEVIPVEVCVKYTFGQPVRGNVSLHISNNGWGRYRAETTHSAKIFGCKKIAVPSSELKINDLKYFVYSLSIKVDFEEEGTGNKAEESANVQITRTALTIKDAEEDRSSLAKPELPFFKEVTVTFPSGSPAGGEVMQVCAGEACRNLTTDAAGKLLFAVPPHLTKGVQYVKVESVKYKSKTNPGSSREIMRSSRQNFHHGHLFSPSNSSLLMKPESSSFECPKGQTIVVKMPVMFAASNMTEASVYVQAISRGQIQYWSSQTVQMTPSELPVDKEIMLEPIAPPKLKSVFRGEFTITLELPPTVSPTVKVLMWYSRQDGEVVSDYSVLKVSECLSNHVALSWPKSRVEQGTVLNLTLNAEPKSLCSLGIVDKSVELMNKQEPLTIQKVFDNAVRSEVADHHISQIDDREYCSRKLKTEEETDEIVPTGLTLRKRRSSPPRWGGGGYTSYHSSYSDALAMFDKVGLHVVSDLTLETRPCTTYFQEHIYLRSPGGIRRDGMLGMPGPGPDGVVRSTLYSATSQGFSSAVEKEIKRTYFPETWLWQLQTVPSDGSLVQELTLPDTITEWVGKAVCVHPSAGLGLSTVTSIVTFTPFFVDLTVLPSVKKGEVMPIIISVFNYQEHAMPVRVTLEGSSDYEILGAEGPDALADQSTAGVRSVCVSSNDRGTVTVRVRPMTVGDVNVTVTAEVDAAFPETCGPEVIVNKVDRVVKAIKVDFEGFPKETTWSKYMCSADVKENSDVFEEWVLDAPSGIVEDSARSWLTAVGDLMGPTLENLGHLIRMPYGCGEQNMLNFAPNIFVLQYLEASGQSNNATTEKLKKFMKSGYQRELKYKHRDGSYSAFGESDASGSTWLTAFVLKSFAQARQYIEVDGDEISLSRSWLGSLQKENGCFESVGKVFHKGMKGGLAEGASPKVLTAYILAALVEAGEGARTKVVTDAVFCLQGGPEVPSDKGSNPYEVAQIAHALARAGLPTAGAYINHLMSLAVETAADLYWQTSSGKDDHSSKGVAVETAGYALMAMTALKPEKYKEQSHKIVKWMSSQRNSQGGFHSTQDTIVALQAMAMHESTLTQEPQDLSLSVVGGDGALATTLKITEDNKLLTQRVEVPSLPANVMFDMAGTGCTMVQGVVRYNVRERDVHAAFGLTVTSRRQGDVCGRVKTCATYQLADGASNMAVIEVNLVSGYVPEKKDLKRVVGDGKGNIKRYEVDGPKVMFYIDELTAEETCVEFGVDLVVEVEGAKPGTVVVYDYYEPELTVSETYDMEHCPLEEEPLPPLILERLPSAPRSAIRVMPPGPPGQGVF